MTASLVLLVRAALAVLLVTAAAGKLRGRRRWRAFVASLVPVAGTLAGPVARGVVAIEATSVVLLVGPRTWALGLAVAAGLLATFAGGIAHAVRAGRRIHCRCFGADAGELDAVAALRNAVLALLAAAAAGISLRGSAVLPPGPARAFVLPLALASGFSLTRWDDVVYAARSFARVTPLPAHLPPPLESDR